MTANELADELEICSCVYYDTTTKKYFEHVDLLIDSANMLRQQAQEIENLKSKVQYWKGLHR